MKYAEIMKGKVRFIGESPELPVFSGSITAVEVPEDVDIQEGYVYEKGNFRAQTTDEITAELKPNFNASRVRIFEETEWVRKRHADRVELKIDDKENWKAWLGYWQALRDMTNQPDFDIRNPTWPTKPE